MITLRRVASYADRFRAYNVVIDGQVVGKIKCGETQVFPLPPPGNHQIWVTIDWCRSNTLDFTCNNSPLNFECASSLRGVKVWLAIFSLFSPTSYCTIRQV